MPDIDSLEVVAKNNLSLQSISKFPMSFRGSLFPLISSLFIEFSVQFFFKFVVDFEHEQNIKAENI